jgi:hypothetical protein
MSVLAVSAAPCATGTWRIVQQKGSEMLEVRASQGGRHNLVIDDAAGFRAPVVKVSFRGSRLQVRGRDVGLIPGIDYHARLDGASLSKDFRIVLNTFTEPEASCANLRRTWEESGRKIAGDSASRLAWDSKRGAWTVLPHEPLIGQSLYPVEYYLRAALHGARACNDFQTLDEVAQYYIAMLQFTEPLGALLSRLRQWRLYRAPRFRL